MSRNRVEVARRAVKTIRQLSRNDQQRIRAANDLLADEPRPEGCVALSGEDAVYRVRVGAYPILYEALDDRLVVHIIRVGHRREVHRPLAKSDVSMTSDPNLAPRGGFWWVSGL